MSILATEVREARIAMEELMAKLRAMKRGSEEGENTGRADVELTPDQLDALRNADPWRVWKVVSNPNANR